MVENRDRNPHLEAPTGILRFSEEAREAIRAEGGVVYSLTGQSIKSLKEEGRSFFLKWSKNGHRDFEALPSRRSEVAVFPQQLFLAGSNTSLRGQLEMIAGYSGEISGKFPGAAAIMGEAADYIELAFLHNDATGIPWYVGTMFGNGDARTITPIGKYAFARTPTSTGPVTATVGHLLSELSVRRFPHDLGIRVVFAAPLIVPSGILPEYEQKAQVTLHILDSSRRPQQSEGQPDIRRFSTAAREKLINLGYVIYTFNGKSLRTLSESNLQSLGMDLFSDDYVYNMPSLLSEVAIHPDNLFLPKSNDKSIDEQLEMVAKFSTQISQRVKGTKAILGEAQDYIELIEIHKNATGEVLFERDADLKTTPHLVRIEDGLFAKHTTTSKTVRRYIQTRTETVLDEWAYVVNASNQEPGVSPYPDGPNNDIFVAPLIVPSGE